MGAVVIFPWIAGPLVASADVLRVVRYLAYLGALTWPVVDSLHPNGDPILVVVSCVLTVLGALVIRRLTKPSPQRSDAVQSRHGAGPSANAVRPSVELLEDRSAP